MRKLNSDDLRAAIKVFAGHKGELLPLLKNKDMAQIDAEQLGFDVMNALMQTDAVDLLFDRVEDIAGQSPIPLDELPDIIGQIVKENDIRGFFTKSWAAVTRGG